MTREQTQMLIDCIDLRVMDLLVTERSLMMRDSYNESHAIMILREELEEIKQVLEETL